MQSLGFRLPVVKSPRDANAGGRRMSEFKANRHELGAGAWDVIVVFVVFHSGEFNRFLWQNSFTEHFCDEKDDDGSEKASASEKIDQGVTRGGK
jgi:hypothetical protein